MKIPRYKSCPICNFEFISGYENELLCSSYKNTPNKDHEFFYCTGFIDLIWLNNETRTSLYITDSDYWEISLNYKLYAQGYNASELFNFTDMEKTKTAIQTLLLYT